MRNTGPQDYGPVPEAVAQLVSHENPNRFLAYCSEGGLTPTVASLLRGLKDPDRAYAWVYCEVHCLGARPAVLNPLVECYWGTRGRDVPSGASSDPAADPAPAPDQESPAESRADESSCGSVPEFSAGEFEKQVQEALGIARSMDRAEVEGRLDAEIDREDTRKHVVAALNRRLDELDTDDETAVVNAGRQEALA